MPDRDEVESTQRVRVRLRMAAALALAVGVLFLAIEARYRHAATLRGLLGTWAVHTTLATTALLASYVRLDGQRLDRVILLVVLGQVINGHVYLYLSPSHPSLVADGLICLLMVSAVFFSWEPRRLVIVAVLATAGFALAGASAWTDLDPAAFSTAFSALLVGAVIAVASGSVLDELRRRLARRQRELATLSARLMSAQEEERRRLSRELHDEFGQSLTAVNAYLWLIDRQLPEELVDLRSRTAEARRVVAQTQSAMRELSQLLRPSVLDDFGLVPSLDTHLKTFAARHQIATSLDADGLPDRLPPEFETAIYRIAQEALTNVARHASAQRVRVALVADDGELRLEVEDDGVGVRPNPDTQARAGIGLIGIRERARALGGTVRLESSKKGVRLRVAMPLPRMVVP
jgi:signal transduction histidine kinase